MMILMGNRPRRTESRAAETGYAIVDFIYHRLLRCLIKDKTVGGTDIQAHPATPAGLVVNGHFEHLLIPPDCSDGRTVPGDRNIKLHPAEGMGGTGKTRIITADDELQPVQDRLVAAVLEETIRPFLQ
jgi:hypothetical protein